MPEPGGRCPGDPSAAREAAAERLKQRRALKEQPRAPQLQPEDSAAPPDSSDEEDLSKQVHTIVAAPQLTFALQGALTTTSTACLVLIPCSLELPVLPHKDTEHSSFNGMQDCLHSGEELKLSLEDLTPAEKQALQIVEHVGYRAAMEASLATRYTREHESNCTKQGLALVAQRILDGTPAGALTYGEIAAEGILATLHKCKKRGLFQSALDGAFLDLGSGRGQVVLLAASTGLFRTCHGIECVQGLHEMALRHQAQFSESMQGLMATEVELEFHCQDFLQGKPWPQVTTIFVALTCFGGEARSLLLQKMESCVRLGTVMLCNGGELENSHFELVDTHWVITSWAREILRVYLCVKQAETLDSCHD